jgi:hypothetical protein
MRLLAQRTHIRTNNPELGSCENFVLDWLHVRLEKAEIAGRIGQEQQISQAAEVV